jgi:hypothetical protein
MFDSDSIHTITMIPEVVNKGLVDTVNSFSMGGRTHHIDVIQCFLRELD